MGPASIAVCISSPVLSKNPVFMNTVLSLAALMHSFRLTVVRLSSSIIPILRVFLFNSSASSTSEKILQANLTSSGPCILGLTM